VVADHQGGGHPRRIILAAAAGEGSNQEENMSKAYFVVRSVVEEPLRMKFDAWYSANHLPMALSEFKAEKCWRFWSAADQGVHYAVYQFPDMARLDAALKSDGFKRLVADFDQAWPSGVTRTRDMLNVVEERSG
jgi:hypothetical protein